MDDNARIKTLAATDPIKAMQLGITLLLARGKPAIKPVPTKPVGQAGQSLAQRLSGVKPPVRPHGKPGEPPPLPPAVARLGGREDQGGEHDSSGSGRSAHLASFRANTGHISHAVAAAAHQQAAEQYHQDGDEEKASYHADRAEQHAQQAAAEPDGRTGRPHPHRGVPIPFDPSKHTRGYGGVFAPK